MAKDSRRSDRVAAAIREEIASYLTTGVKDPRIQGFVTVTGVDITPDLRRAQVFISIMGDVDVKSTVDALNDVGYKIKGQVGRNLKLRLAPELDFKIDNSAARASRIEMLLKQIKDEQVSSTDGSVDSDQVPGSEQ